MSPWDNAKEILQDVREASEEERLEEELAADGSVAGVEKEAEEPYPFDAEKISISNKPVPLETLIRRLKQGTISSPLIQRGAGIWDDEQQSRLIESLMLRIPLPMFYVAADGKENWKVVDGLQRVTAIKRYVLDKEFKLSGLEFIKECEGKKFDKLPQQFQNRILETEFQFAIIDPSTPDSVQRNVFKRLNTGGLPLTPQEIRHALYYGRAAELLKELVQSDSFKRATAGSVNDSRMAGRELVLRCLAFLMFGYESYPKNGDMDSFLCNAMKVINCMPKPDEKVLASIWGDQSKNILLRYDDELALIEKFELAMNRAAILFERHAFRKSTRGYQRSPINKSLFEVWSYVLSEMSDAVFDSLIDAKASLYSLIFDMTYEDPLDDFGKAISRDSHKYSGVMHRYRAVNNVVNRALVG